MRYRAAIAVGVVVAVGLLPAAAATLASALAFVGVVLHALGHLVDEARLREAGGKLAVAGLAVFMLVPAVASLARVLVADPRVQVGAAVVLAIVLVIALFDLASRFVSRLPKAETQRVEPPRVRRRAVVVQDIVSVEPTTKVRVRRADHDDLDLLGRRP